VGTNNRGLKAITQTALLAALLAGAAAAAAADKPKEEVKPAVSAELKKPLSDIDVLLKANKFPEALEKLHAADAMSGKSPYDQHMINQMTAFACSKTNDVPCVAKALQGQIDDGFSTPDDNQKFSRLVAQVSFQAKDYDKAIDYGNRAIKSGSAPDEIYGVVGASYYLKDDFKDAIQLEDSHIADVVKQGKTPKSEDLNVYLSSCAKAKDDACTAKALEYQVTYYPKPQSWLDVVSLVHPKGDVETLQTYRLMSDVGAMSNADDYLDMANTALGRGSPGDAQHALQMGSAAGVLPGSKGAETQKLTAEAKKAAAADQTSLGRSEEEANASANGMKNAAAGFAYLGYQQYDKAADQLSKAITKGGLKNEADTRLNLGVAQLKAGHKDDAVKTFQSVHGSPVMERLASLWVIHAKQT
jgi:tetratricopeptide (TPR) repeat protein